MTELLASLQERSLSVLERLEVARSLWKQDGLLHAGKAPFLLKWACQEICQAYSKRNKNPPNHVTTTPLWEFLNVLVEALCEGNGSQDLSALNMHLFQVKYGRSVNG